MENKGKAETFLGFAIRAGKFRIGANSLETLKRADLVIVCKTASDNTKKHAEKLAKKLNAKLLETVNKSLSEMAHKDNAKIMAVLDQSLAKGIIDNSEKYFVARNF